MTPKTLRFRARGTALCQHFEAMFETGTRRYVGRKFGELADQPGRYGWHPTGESEEVPYAAEYVKACADGDLYPADQTTFDACAAYAAAHGLPSPVWDPAAAAPAASPPKSSTTPAAKPAEKGSV
jgi:hypothetical protein